MNSENISKNLKLPKLSWKDLYRGHYDKIEYIGIFNTIKQSPVKLVSRWEKVKLYAQFYAIKTAVGARKVIKTTRVIMNIPGVDFVLGLTVKKFLVPFELARFVINKLPLGRLRTKSIKENIMEESPNKITAAEGVRLGAKTLDNIADALEDQETPDTITRGEWMSIGQKALADAWDAYRN